MQYRKPGVFLAVWVMTLVAALPALAADSIGALTVEFAWARASAGPAKAGAAYVSIRNASTTADRLVAASTPVSRSATLHTHVMTGNMMRMRPVDGLPIAPSATLTLKPGGDHLMLMGLRASLKKGGHFPLTLRFEKAGEITVTVTVQGVGARGPAGMQMRHGGHK